MAKSQSLNNLFIEGCFNYGCIEVQDLADLSLSTANFLSAPYELNILLMSYLDEPWKGVSHIAIHIFNYRKVKKNSTRFKRGLVMNASHVRGCLMVFHSRSRRSPLGTCLPIGNTVPIHALVATSSTFTHPISKPSCSELRAREAQF